MRKKMAMIFLLLLLCGCARQEPAVPAVPTAAPTVVATEVPVTMPPAVESEAVALAEAPPPAVSVVLEAEPSGEKEERSTDAVIDYSHTEEGYIMARYTSELDVNGVELEIDPTYTIYSNPFTLTLK